MGARGVGIVVIAAIVSGTACGPRCGPTEVSKLGTKLAGELPELDERPALYERVSRLPTQRLHRTARVCVDDRGAVASAELRTSTGDAPFDGQVIAKLRTWRYCPAKPPRNAVVCEDIELTFMAGITDTEARPGRRNDGPQPAQTAPPPPDPANRR